MNALPVFIAISLALVSSSTLPANEAQSLQHWIELLRHPDANRRLEAIAAIGLFRDDAKPAVAELTKFLNANHVQIRAAAAQALARIGPASQPAVPLLIDLVRANALSPKLHAITALREIGTGAKEAVPALLKSLDSKNYHVQYLACRALGQIGVVTPEISDKLTELASDGMSSVRRRASEALGNLGSRTGPAAIDALCTALKDRNEVVRETAAAALGKLGPDAKNAIPSLREVLAKRIIANRPVAAHSLWKISGHADEALDVLIAELKSPHTQLKSAELLGEMKSVAEPAIDALLMMMQSNDEENRQAAALTLGEIGIKRDDVISALKSALEDEHGIVRKAATLSIDSLSPMPNP